MVSHKVVFKGHICFDVFSLKHVVLKLYNFNLSLITEYMDQTWFFMQKLSPSSSRDVEKARLHVDVKNRGQSHVIISKSRNN